MRRFGVAAAAAVLSLALGVAAHAQAMGQVFATVDSVTSETHRLWITGIQQGQVAPTEVFIDFYISDDAARASEIQTCERKALLAMTKPGQYLFEVNYRSTYGYPMCKLTRVNP